MYDQNSADQIGAYLKEHVLTIAVAESVTSGHLQAAMSLGMDASQYFQGGLTAYNVGQKCRHLNVEPIHAQKVNSVDETVARKLAVEVSKLFLSDYGIGITGYASIVPECEEEGLHAFFALSFRYEVVLEKQITSSRPDGFETQVDFANQVIAEVSQFLVSKKKRP
ncbi:nicotinamide-nucleotide amidohydrolase family protein [Segetibacter sp. 3557_3]|uniref:CinA family protein n=1 Tax=Segetibacter sp. 3557_3 TaxID=2547429 RepID=UPI001058671C|nr:nicotinamide-nucleotide amidohydrolase family protein [Segetibacter sp. 3557_3]TDH29130.1 nicotinamide-nucleotide amidohydrolase family protein [Segetibacter sp. 3557_3]